MATKRDFMLFLSSILLILLFCPDGLNTTAIRTNDPQDIGSTQIDVDCVWGEWKKGECSKSCGLGLRKDVRKKLVVEEHGGTCEGKSSREKNCQLKPCTRTGVECCIDHGVPFSCLDYCMTSASIDQSVAKKFTGTLCEKYKKIIDECKRNPGSEKAAENPPSDASMVQSEDAKQKAVCAPDAESIAHFGITIDDNHRTMDDVGKVGDMKYCEVRGTFVFYSERNYKGNIKHAVDGTDAMVQEMEPKDSILTEIRSVRIAGHHEQWDADTITFYADEDFSGNPEMFDDEVSSSDLDNPGSAIVTGSRSSLWSVFDDQGNCWELKPADAKAGHAQFYRSLKQSPFYGNKIVKVVKAPCPSQ